ncbi:hypothetical protein M436DRAFT_64657 [Aureobasidium namibiae CBS 147.97]|uniref:Uncharacterized protein n=1 Tax=Aureobasidium namibiae CBS 147.97 TaxID=1043004 RepID=A0A074WI16_9PEZI
MDTGTSPNTTSTKMVSIVTQDSAFLKLPLELRHQIYNYFIRVRLKKGVTSNALKPLTNMTGVSQQIRREVYDIVAAVKTLHVSAGVFSDLTLKLLSTAINIRSMNHHASASFELLPLEVKSAFQAARNRTIQKLKDEIENKKVPAQFKFWKKKEVCVCRPGIVEDDSSDFKKAFIDAMLKFTKGEGFNGVTIQDVSRFLEQVTMPDPKGFWKAEEMFEELKEARDYGQDEDTGGVSTE